MRPVKTRATRSCAASLADGSFFRLEPVEARLVEGFGAMRWVDAVGWQRALGVAHG